MSHFNFQNLTPEEFETLAQDVMQRLLGTPLFRYAAGKDGGIDLCDDIRTNRIIVQCKRYGQNYQILLQSLKEERQKLDRLAPVPEKYYVFTSVGLLPKQKKTVLELFQPYMESEANIIDAIAIENFFSAPQNYDLIPKNNNLFVAYPTGYNQFEINYKLQEIQKELGAAIQRDRDNHPSFALMSIDEIDRKLFADIDISAEAIDEIDLDAEADDLAPVSPVWQRILNTWKENENHSVVIEGVGGIGKTVSLFSVTKNMSKYSPAPAIYVPLHKLINDDGKCLPLSSFLENKFPFLYREIDHLAAQKWVNGPHLLLLLDGFNEVPGTMRRKLLGMINEWRRDHCGTQLIAVTRPMDNINLRTGLAGNPIHIRLKPIQVEKARAFLTKWGFSSPPDNDKVWENLIIPLFLVLYVKTGKLGVETNSGYPLLTKSATTGGAIIWNYLQRELMKKESEEWVIQCAVACEYIIPYIAYQMLQGAKYSISHEDANKLIVEAVSQFDYNMLPKSLEVIFQVYKEEHHNNLPKLYVRNDDGTGRKQRCEEQWCDIVLRGTGVLSATESSSAIENGIQYEYKEITKSGTLYYFPHQNFRDCLAGIYLINQAEQAKGGLFPDVWNCWHNPLVWDYISELIDEETSKKLWTINRAVQQHENSEHTVNHIATCNLIELKKRNRSLIPLMDFSGMDLRGLSLNRYLNDDSEICQYFFRDSALSKRTLLDTTSFQNEGHSAAITCLAVLHNQTVVSGSADCTLRIWDPSTGQCLKILAGHQGSISCVLVLPNDLIVSSADSMNGKNDCQIRIWDSNTGDCIFKLKGHAEQCGVTCLAAFPDGRIISGSTDKTLRIWNSSTGECLHVLNGHEGMISCATALNNNWIVSGSNDCTLRVWDALDGKCVQILTGHTEKISCLAVLPDGLIASGSEDRTIRIWDLSTGQCKQILSSSKEDWTGHFGSITCIDAQSNYFISSSKDGRICVWDIRSGKNLKYYSVDKAAVNTVSYYWASNKDYILAGTSSGFIILWELDSGERVKTFEGHTSSVACLKVLPDKTIISGSYDHSVRVWDFSKEQCKQTLGRHIEKVNFVGPFSQKQIISLSFDNRIHVWDSITLKCTQTLATHCNQISSVAILPDNRLAGGLDNGDLRIWDLKTGEIENVIAHGARVVFLGVLPNGHLVSYSKDASLCVWDLKNWRCTNNVVTSPNGNCKLAILPNNQLLIGSDDGSLIKFDVESGHSVQMLSGHQNGISALAVLTNSLIAISYADKHFRILDMNSGMFIPSVVFQTDLLIHSAILPDGRVASSSGNKNLYIWDPITGRSTPPLLGHSGPITCVMVLSDNRIVSASEDGTIRLWDAADGNCIGVLRAMEIDATKLNLSQATLDETLTKLLWQNGAKISNADYENYVMPFRKA